MSAIYILWLRELKHYYRSPAQLFAALAQPVLYLLALGFGLGPVFAKAGNGSYLQFLAPGVVGMILLFSGVYSGLGLAWDRQMGYLKQTLVAPVPRALVILGRTLGGATVAACQGMLILLACLIAGFRPVSLNAAPLALLVIALVAIVVCTFSTIIATRTRNMQTFPLIINLAVTPLFFLSGALYPLDGLPAPMRVITNANPLSYGIDGLRSVLIGISHFGLPQDLGVLAIVAASLLALSVYSFSTMKP